MFLEVKNLDVNLGEFYLKDINLSIKEGEYLVLIGPTGSGKSVLLETIIGFFKPDKGTITLNGEVINDFPPEKRGIGIVYQNNVLFPNMNVYENIEYGIKEKFSKKEKEEKILKIAKFLKIDHILHRSIINLSGGESQRTCLARALIVKPKIILMDEPFSALDISTQAKLTSLIKEIGRIYKTTFLHVTHNFNDIWNLADRVGVMKDGKIHQIGHANEVFSRPENDFVADFVGVQNIIEGEIIEINEKMVKIELSNGIVINSSDYDYLKDNISAKNQSNNGKEVFLAIRPENMIFSNELFESSVRNQLKGKVVDLIELGPNIWVDVDVNNHIFKGLLTKSSGDILEIKKGKEIYISFKSLNVNIIDKCSSFNNNNLN